MLRFGIHTTTALSSQRSQRHMDDALDSGIFHNESYRFDINHEK